MRTAAAAAATTGAGAPRALLAPASLVSQYPHPADHRSNPTLGNFIALLNPISWSIYWMVVRRGQKQRDAKKEDRLAKDEQGKGAASTADAARQQRLGELSAAQATDPPPQGQGGAEPEPEPEELWWEEMLAIQIVATILTALFSVVGVAISGWAEQMETVRPIDLPIYVCFGVYIPLVLLLFSLAPRYIMTAEMGCAPPATPPPALLGLALSDGSDSDGRRLRQASRCSRRW